MFDFSLLSASHLWLALTVFSGTALMVKFAVKQKVLYAGLPVIAVTVLAASLVLPSALALGLIISAGLIAVGGGIDEKFNLPARHQIFWQTAAAIAAVSFGWTIPYVSHPLASGVLHLDWIYQGNLIFPGSLLAVIWLVAIINAVNWLDGVDGLSASVTGTAFLVLAFISLLSATQDQQTFELAIIGLGAISAFIVFNWHPARITLGTSGVWFISLYLGLTAIVGGGKIATTLLVLSLPLVDAGLVIFQRLLKKRPPWQGRDQRHLHDRLKKYGWSPRRIAISAAIFTSIVGLAGIVLGTNHKILAIFIIILLFAGMLATLSGHVDTT